MSFQIESWFYKNYQVKVFPKSFKNSTEQVDIVEAGQNDQE